MKRGTYILDANVSKCHKQVLLFFQKRYPQWKLVQNQTLKIEGHSLYADVFIEMPHLLIVEIHGEQHYSHIPYFHKTAADFEHAQELDRLKKIWADMNGFAFVEVDGREKFDPDSFNKKMMQSIMDNLKRQRE